jgi:hypothetical protein
MSFQSIAPFNAILDFLSMHFPSPTSFHDTFLISLDSYAIILQVFYPYSKLFIRTFSDIFESQENPLYIATLFV